MKKSVMNNYDTLFILKGDKKMDFKEEIQKVKNERIALSMEVITSLVEFVKMASKEDAPAEAVAVLPDAAKIVLEYVDKLS